MRRTLALACAALCSLALCVSGARAGARGGGGERGGPPGGGSARQPGGPRGMAPGEEPGSEEESEPGTVYVIEDSDKVILRDGTVVEGTVLCAGQAAVTILTPDGEKTIPREQIERVIKNTDGSFPKKYMAEETDGHKFLIEAPPDLPPGDGGGGGPAPAPARTPRARPAPKGAPKAPAKRQPKAPAKARPAAPKMPGGMPNLKSLPKDPAQLRSLLQRLQKEGKLQDLIKDPRAAELLRKARQAR